MTQEKKTSELKTFLEEEKMIVTSIFSFPYNGFYPINVTVNFFSAIALNLDNWNFVILKSPVNSIQNLAKYKLVGVQLSLEYCQSL